MFPDSVAPVSSDTSTADANPEQTPLVDDHEEYVRDFFRELLLLNIVSSDDTWITQQCPLMDSLVKVAEACVEKHCGRTTQQNPARASGEDEAVIPHLLTPMACLLEIRQTFQKEISSVPLVREQGQN
jgi:hypothetical protein